MVRRRPRGRSPQRDLTLALPRPGGDPSLASADPLHGRRLPRGERSHPPPPSSCHHYPRRPMANARVAESGHGPGSRKCGFPWGSRTTILAERTPRLHATRAWRRAMSRHNPSWSCTGGRGRPRRPTRPSSPAPFSPLPDHLHTRKWLPTGPPGIGELDPTPAREEGALGPWSRPRATAVVPTCRLCWPGSGVASLSPGRRAERRRQSEPSSRHARQVRDWLRARSRAAVANRTHASRLPEVPPSGLRFRGHSRPGHRQV